MSLTYRFEVYGLPTAQGSKRAFVSSKTGRAHVVETNASKVKTWREDVKAAALTALEAGDGVGMSGPVNVGLRFYFPRPKSHYRTGKNSHLLRGAAPIYPASKPDIDKVIRSTFDAITTSGLWGDDRQVVMLLAEKFYANETHHVGAIVLIEELVNAQGERA